VAGTWRIVHGTPEFPDASVYQLDADASHGPILLLRVDDNLVLFLNQQRRPLPGTADFSDTLTRSDHAGRVREGQGPALRSREFFLCR